MGGGAKKICIYQNKNAFGMGALKLKSWKIVYMDLLLFFIHSIKKSFFKVNFFYQFQTLNKLLGNFKYLEYERVCLSLYFERWNEWAMSALIHLLIRYSVLTDIYSNKYIERIFWNSFTDKMYNWSKSHVLVKYLNRTKAIY